MGDVAELELLISSLVMGAVLLGVVVALSGGRNWRKAPRPSTERGREPTGFERPNGGTQLPGERAIAEQVRRSRVWFVGFLVLTLGLGAGIVLAAGDPSLTVVTMGIVGAIVAGYLLVGVYLTSRYRGRSSAAAAFEAVSAFGLLTIVAIVVALVVA